MKISGVDIRPGNIIEYEGGIWRAVKIQHTQPGKGGAYMQVEMKNLIDGRKTNVRFRSAETVERVRLDTKDFQFLFRDTDMLTFMDKDNYEQISLPADLLGEAGEAPQRQDVEALAAADSDSPSSATLHRDGEWEAASDAEHFEDRRETGGWSARLKGRGAWARSWEIAREVSPRSRAR